MSTMRKKQRGLSVEWPEKERKLAFSLRKKRIPVSEIAEKVGRSEMAVSMMFHRHDLENKPQKYEEDLSLITKLEPYDRVRSVLGLDYRFDERTGQHFVRKEGTWHPCCFLELFDHAGMERPHQDRS